MDFPKRLKQLREQSGLLQKELAKKLHMSNAVYNNYELGKRNPNYESLKQIAEYFGVSVDYLIGNTDFLKSIHTNRSMIGSVIEKEDIKNGIIIADMDGVDIKDIDIEKLKKAIELGLFKKTK